MAASRAPAGGTDLSDALYGLAAVIVGATPRDLSLTAASTLSLLDRRGPQRITALAESQGVAQPSMTTLVTRLEQAGLVRRQHDPSDGRVVLVSLADGGAEYLAERRRRGRAAVSDLLDQLPARDRAALAAALPAIQRVRELASAAASTPEVRV